MPSGKRNKNNKLSYGNISEFALWFKYNGQLVRNKYSGVNARSGHKKTLSWCMRTLLIFYKINDFRYVKLIRGQKMFDRASLSITHLA